MNLHFESLDELHDMIAAMGYVKADSAPIMLEAPEPGDDPVPLDVLAENAQCHAEQGNEPAPTEQPEQTKRKRRTKAEMEAARAAEASTGNSSTTDSSNAVAGSNPFETSTSNPSTATQAILSAPSGQAATLAGIQAMQSSPFDTAPAAVASNPTTDTAVIAETSPTQSIPATGVDAATCIETRSLEILSTQTEPLTAVKHMHLCRDFIAKHGQAKYLEGFALAGLPATIGTYKPEQCAKHQAALEFLSLNA